MIEKFIEFIIIIILLFFSPGVTTIFSTFSGIKHGFKKTLPYILGVLIVAVIYSFLMGSGAGLVFKKYPFIVIWIKGFGGLFFLFLAIKLYINSINPKKKKGQLPTFKEGVIIMLLNPKFPVIVLILYSTFAKTNPSLQEIIMITIGAVAALGLSLCLWTFLGVYFSRFIKKENKKIDQSFSVIFILLAIWIVWFS